MTHKAPAANNIPPTTKCCAQGSTTFRKVAERTPKHPWCGVRSSLLPRRRHQSRKSLLHCCVCRVVDHFGPGSAVTWPLVRSRGLAAQLCEASVPFKTPTSGLAAKDARPRDVGAPDCQVIPSVFGTEMFPRNIKASASPVVGHNGGRHANRMEARRRVCAEHERIMERALPTALTVVLY